MPSHKHWQKKKKTTRAKQPVDTWQAGQGACQHTVSPASGHRTGNMPADCEPSHWTGAREHASRLCTQALDTEQGARQQTMSPALDTGQGACQQTVNLLVART